MKHLLLLLLAGSLTALISFSVRTTKFSVVGAGAEASPTDYVGPCPGIIKFNGKIQSDGPGTVKYTWVRSDGATGPVESVDFTSAGVQYVGTTWTLGQVNALPHYEGWEQIKILYPNEFLSNKADFKLTCTSR